MYVITRLIRLAVIALPALPMAAAGGQPAEAPTAAELAEQIEALRREYEARIQALETQLLNLERQKQAAPPKAAGPSRSMRARARTDNTLNPAIGVVLSGMVSDFSADEADVPGFQLGHEGERAARGLSLDHSEITVSSNVDDKFFGSLTLGLDTHPNEPVELELEEAYIQTLPGAGLPDGVIIKAGRAFWTLGYLNERHAHGDDFSDRPLPYRVFLDQAYNDDGAELSLVLPTDFYSEAGVGVFRGGDTPFGGSSDGLDAWSAYARLGGDIGRNSAWRIGGYVLDGKARNRGEGHAHGEDDHGEDDHEEDDHGEDDHEEEGHEEEGHDDEHGHAEFFSDGMFSGDVRLYGLDFRATWAPTGNAREGELMLQGEYFWREENGTYTLAAEDGGETERAERFDSMARGWYVQAVYRFLPRWRVGARYARLHTPGEAELGHDPNAFGAMVDWTNSEFGRLRLQYNRESLAEDRHDNQIMLHYIMSIGAHGAHAF